MIEDDTCVFKWSKCDYIKIGWGCCGMTGLLPAREHTARFSDPTGFGWDRGGDFSFPDCG